MAFQVRLIVKHRFGGTKVNLYKPVGGVRMRTEIRKAISRIMRTFTNILMVASECRLVL